MSMWTAASDELSKYLAVQEVERQQRLAEHLANQDRAYRVQRDQIGDARNVAKDAQDVAEAKARDEDRKRQRDQADRDDRYRNATILRQTGQPGALTKSQFDAMAEFNLDQGVAQKTPGLALKIARPAAPVAEGDIPTLPTETNAQMTEDQFKMLGGTEFQQKQRDAEARAEQAAATAAANAERAAADRASREQTAADNRASREGIAALARSMHAQGALTPYQRMNYQNSLRDDFTRESKTFSTVAQQYRELRSTLGRGDAAGDRAAIFNFMRALDPTSVVRESEQATAENARGVPESMRAWWNKVVTGQALTPEQREQFLGTVGGIYKSGLEAHQRRVSEYSADAEAAGVNPQRVIRDYTVADLDKPAAAATPTNTPTTPAAGSAPAGGVVEFVRDKNGKLVRKQ